jgi:hypothetical protein
VVVAPDALRVAKYLPSRSPFRSTLPLFTKDSAVTESDGPGDSTGKTPSSSVPVLVSVPPIDRVEPLTPASESTPRKPLLLNDPAVDSEAAWMRKRDPAVLVSAPAAERAEPGFARETKPLLVIDPVVDTEAPPKRKREPAMSPSAVNALFEPRAALFSMKALFPVRVNCEEAAIVLICPFRNSIALSTSPIIVTVA